MYVLSRRLWAFIRKRSKPKIKRDIVRFGANIVHCRRKFVCHFCRYRCYDKYWLISTFCMYYKCSRIISYLLKILLIWQYCMLLLHGLLRSPHTILIQITQVDCWHRSFTHNLLAFPFMLCHLFWIKLHILCFSWRSKQI